MSISKTNLSLALAVLINARECCSTEQVLHILDPNIDYVSRRYPYEQEGDKLFTDFFHPTKRTQQMAELYKEQPQELPQEPQQWVLKRVIPDKDGRERIEDTERWPFSFIGQMSIYFSNSDGSGSGALIGPHHFLTAAHNVYWYPDKEHKQKKEWVKKLIVHLALNEGSMPFPEVRSTRIYTFKEWIEREDPAYDIALVILNRSIGKETGWSGLLCRDEVHLLQQTIHITGYPNTVAGKYVGCKQMWTMSDAFKKIKGDRVFYDIDTSKGQSGAPIWIREYGHPYVLGIHTQGDEQENKNCGVRLSSTRLKTIVTQWITETRKFKRIDEASISNWLDAAIAGNELARQLLQTAAEHGYVEAKIALGDIYYKGYGTDKDEARAIKLYQQAAAQENPKAQFRLGLIYEQERIPGKSKVDAFDLYLKAAKQGHAEALFKVGRLYATNGDFGLDRSQAKRYYRRAAKKDYIPAYYALGLFYEKKEDYNKAVEWYTKAASKGYASAQVELGYCYDNGQGVARNECEAFFWYKQASEKGHPLGQIFLGLMYAGGRGGVKMNINKAMELCRRAVEKLDWLKKAAEEGNKVVQTNLGVMYAQGLGLPKDVDEAEKWLRAASDQGYPRAKYILGILYEEEETLRKNRIGIATHLIQTAAESGYAPAQFWIASEGHRMRWGLSRESIKWYQEAAQQAYPPALYELGLIYKGGWGIIKQDEYRAYHLLCEAAKQGYLKAQLQLGNWCQRWGKVSDAIKWFTKAAEQEDVEAQLALATIYAEEGALQDRQSAFLWSKKAVDIAKQEHKYLDSEPYLQLGKMYADGWGVEANAIEAIKCLKKAANKGSQEAQNELEKLRNVASLG